MSTPISLDRPAYRLRLVEVATCLNTSLERGLSTQEAKQRHDQFGDNAIEEGKGVSIWKVLFRQVANALTLVSPILTLLNITGIGHGYGFVVWNNQLY
jgi:magnesium-transporting ATPase (P-type)